MRGTFFILILLVTAVNFSQSNRVIAGKIVDSETREPLEFVNIKFLETEIGTTTTQSGHFILSFGKEEIRDDLLQISFLGYETRILTTQQLNRFSVKPITIALRASPYNLGEVVLRNPPREIKTIGHRNFTAASMGYWEGEEAIGGEIASVVSIRKAGTRLLKLQFKVIENRSDSVRIKIKFYHYDGGDPQRLLTNTEIAHTIAQKKGLVTIPLRKLQIEANDDILVSIQLEEAFGSPVYLSLSASAYGGLSFIRERTWPHWRPQKTVCVGYKIESSIPVEGGERDLADIQIE
jgi:hypothetical protein